MLAIGLICNLMVRPVAEKWFMTPEELATEKRLAHESVLQTENAVSRVEEHGVKHRPTPPALVLAAWMAVGIPLGWGVYKTIVSASRFFH
jgi:hypothetical protein